MFQINNIFFTKLNVVITLMLISITTIAQEKYTISGTIYDNKNNETLIGVNV